MSRVAATLIHPFFSYQRLLLLTLDRSDSTGSTSLERNLRPFLIFLHLYFLNLFSQGHSFGLFQQNYVAHSDDAEQNEHCHGVYVVSLEIAQVDGTGS